MTGLDDFVASLTPETVDVMRRVAALGDRELELLAVVSVNLTEHDTLTIDAQEAKLADHLHRVREVARVALDRYDNGKAGTT